MKRVANFVDGVLVEIYEKAVKDEQASEKSDVPIYKTIPYIKKKIPNSRDVYDQPMKASDRTKYPELLRQFEAGEEAPLEGTPIDQWPALDVSQVETLKAASILTVQSLAALPESGMHRLPAGYTKLKQKAEKWLNQGQEVQELREQNAKLLKRIEALEKKDAKKGKKAA